MCRHYNQIDSRQARAIDILVIIDVLDCTLYNQSYLRNLPVLPDVSSPEDIRTNILFYLLSIYLLQKKRYYIQCDAIKWEQLEYWHFSRGYNFWTIALILILKTPTRSYSKSYYLFRTWLIMGFISCRLLKSVRFYFLSVLSDCITLYSVQFTKQGSRIPNT